MIVPLTYEWDTIKWKRRLAIFVRRFDRCIHTTEPAFGTLVLLAVVVAFMTGFFPIMEMTHPPIFSMIKDVIFYGIGYTLVLWGLIYGGWETVQGWKWLRKWAESFHYEQEKTARESRLRTSCR